MTLTYVQKATDLLQRYILSKGFIALRAVLFTLALIWAVIDTDTFSLSVFILVSAVAYFKPANNSAGLLWLFVVLVITAPKFIEALTDPVEPLTILFSILFGFLFYIIIAVKKREVLRRQEWHYFTYLMLMYVLYLQIFLGRATIGQFLLLFIALYLLTQEFFYNHKKEGSQRSRRLIRVVSATVSLILLELVWITHILPLSTVQAATAVLVISFIIIELVFRYLQNELTVGRIKYYAVLAFIFTVIIAGTTTWKL